MPIKIHIAYVALTNKASPRAGEQFPCTVSIDKVTLERFDTRVDFRDFKFPELPGGIVERDPVLWLQEIGWSMSDSVGPRPEDRQPAGFQKSGRFESLHVSYRAPVTCACDDEGENKRYLHMTVDYDVASNSVPEIRVEDTLEDGSPKPGNPDKQLKPRITQEAVIDGGRTVFNVTAQVRAFIPCKCSEVNPCEVTFELTYSYWTEVV